MSIYRLEQYLVFAKYLSVKRAARELCITESALSQQLGRLEKDYGATLYTRNGQGITLTDAGRAFLKNVESILLQEKQLTGNYSGAIAEQVCQSLTLGGSHGPSASILPELMVSFEEKHRSIKLRLKPATSPEIETLIRKGQLEIAVITRPSPSSPLQMEPFRTENLCVFARANHPLVRRRKITLKEFAALPLVIREGRKGSNRTEELLDSLRAKGLTPNIYMSCDSQQAVKSVVRRGKGVGILYQDAVKDEFKTGVFKILKVTDLGLTGRSYIVYSKDKPLSPVAR